MIKLFLLLALIATSVIALSQAPANCDKALYYRDMNSIEELASIQSCIKPSITKSEFYKYYFEKLLANRLRSVKGFNGFSDKALSRVVYLCIHSLTKPSFETSDVLENVKKIDGFFSKEKLDISKPNYYEGDLYKALAENYVDSHFIFYEPELINGELIMVYYNVGGMGAGDAHKLLKITKDEVIMMYPDLMLSDVTRKMEKFFGAGCYDGFFRNGMDIKKAGTGYEITVPYYTAKDASCCPSKVVKFTTEDLYDIDVNSLMYGDAIDNGKVNWKKYLVKIQVKKN
jgi:hypothetical protein